jgi:hypothetical protein
MVKEYKAVPLPPCRRKGERGYSSYSFLTSALEGGGGVVSVTPRKRFTHAKVPPVPILKEAGWSPELVWTQRLEEISSARQRSNPSCVQPPVTHYTDLPREYVTFQKKAAVWFI